MFLMQLSENIHDGHSPRILGSENLWTQKYNHAEWFGHFPPTVYIEKLGFGPYCLGSTEKCTYISHHASHAGLQNFGHKGNHIEQLLLAFHISFQ